MNIKHHSDTYYTTVFLVGIIRGYRNINPDSGLYRFPHFYLKSILSKNNFLCCGFMLLLQILHFLFSFFHFSCFSPFIDHSSPTKGAFAFFSREIL